MNCFSYAAQKVRIKCDYAIIRFNDKPRAHISFGILLLSLIIIYDIEVNNKERKKLKRNGYAEITQ